MWHFQCKTRVLSIVLVIGLIPILSTFTFSAVLSLFPSVILGALNCMPGFSKSD